MRYIYFSPHLDDAILSAGGLIHDQTQAGNSVEIWTFFCGFPDEIELSELASTFHTEWRTGTGEETVNTRRSEDKKAAAMVRAKPVHFDFLDCIYRRGKDGSFIYKEIFTRPDPVEADLPAQIAQTMIAWLKPDDVIIAQLAIGGHVDHLIMRNAVEMLKRPVTWIADIPYLLNNPEELVPKTAGMKDSIQPVSEIGLKVWQDTIELYASQLSVLFSTPENMRQKIHGYWAEHRGLRLWQLAQTN